MRTPFMVRVLLLFNVKILRYDADLTYVYVGDVKIVRAEGVYSGYDFLVVK